MDAQTPCLRQEKKIVELRKQIDDLIRNKQGYEKQIEFMVRFAEMISMGVAVHVNGIITYINPSGVAIIKAPNAKAVIGRSAFDFVPPEDVPIIKDRLAQLALQYPDSNSAISPFIEDRLLDIHGNIVNVEIAAFLLAKTESKTSVLVIFRDISEQKRQQQEQARHMARFRQLVSLLPDATIIHKDGVISFANRTALRLLGFATEEELIGRSIFDFIPPAKHETARERIKQVLTAREPLPPKREYILRSQGDKFLAESIIIPFEEDGDCNILIVFRDITEQERMRKARERSEAKFRVLAELLPTSVFIMDENETLLYVNAASKNIIGFSPTEALDVNYRERIHPFTMQRLEGLFRNMKLEESKHFEIQLKNKHDKWVWLDVRLTKTIMDERVVGLGVATDVTWRKETEALLKRQTQKLVKAYEDERERISRELHDEVGQHLIAMKFALERAQHFGTNSEAGAQAIMNARQMLASLTDMVRELSLSFRPPMLDDLGLLPTLLWHIERYTKHTGIQVQFRHAGLEQRRLPKAVEISVFRIIQESLTNVARHAQVDKVEVSIRGDEEQIELFIHDDGVGFTLNNDQHRHSSSGIMGMMERAELLGGHLHIKTAPGRGVTITATIPLFHD